jgi:2-oxoglutarate dehydrogenase E1 component
VLWEAQFGDFMNGAQTIIDEFISSGEQKWGQKSSVVLLLPHGYEGQGPDHSSARVERFLSMCAQDNMTVAIPTTPANYFHLLRWQALSGRGKPLIVFTPKSLLRSKAATSAVEDFTTGGFQPLIGEPAEFNGSGVKRVVLCTGKIYYDLAAQRAKANSASPANEPRPTSRSSTAIVRVERLYPIPTDELRAELSRYPSDAELVWVQEEPSNQGAWPRMALHLPEMLGRPLSVAALPASSAPAPGSAKVHAATHKEIVETAIPAEG